jgi:hypothetical protein
MLLNSYETKNKRTELMMNPNKFTFDDVSVFENDIVTLYRYNEFMKKNTI